LVSSWALLPFFGAIYAVLRNAVAGRSVGKFLCGLFAIDLRTGHRCGRSGSIKRNGLWLLLSANLVAAFLEAATLVRDTQGQRLGDRLASTQVVEGFGARDVVAALQAWWLDFIAHLEGNPRKRGRDLLIPEDAGVDVGQRSDPSRVVERRRLTIAGHVLI